MGKPRKRPRELTWLVRATFAGECGLTDENWITIEERFTRHYRQHIRGEGALRIPNDNRDQIETALSQLIVRLDQTVEDLATELDEVRKGACLSEQKNSRTLDRLLARGERQLTAEGRQPHRKALIKWAKKELNRRHVVYDWSPRPAAKRALEEVGLSFDDLKLAPSVGDEIRLIKNAIGQHGRAKVDHAVKQALGPLIGAPPDTIWDRFIREAAIALLSAGVEKTKTSHSGSTSQTNGTIPKFLDLVCDEVEVLRSEPTFRKRIQNRARQLYEPAEKPKSSTKK